MKKIILFLIASSLAGNLSANVGGLADLANFVGSGLNTSALVIDFNDGSGSESFAWGYRYDSPVSGGQMLVDIAAADPLLDIAYSGTPGDGFSLSSITYDGTSLASSFGATGPESMGWGYYVAGGTAGDAPGNEISGGGVTLPSSWTISPTGAGALSFGVQGRILDDGSWDAWSFGTYNTSWSHIVPPAGVIAAAPVPEPSAYSLIFGALVLGFAATRRRG